MLWFTSFNLAQDNLKQTTELFYILWVQIWFNSSWLSFLQEIGGSNFRLYSTLYLIALIALTPALARAPVHTCWSISDLGTISVTERSCASPISKVERHISDRFCSTLWYNCLVPGRRLSLNGNEREKKGEKDITGENSVPFPWSLAAHHQSLAFRARLYQAKNEASEEEAAPAWCSMFANDSQSLPLLWFILDWTVFLVGTETYPV